MHKGVSKKQRAVDSARQAYADASTAAGKDLVVSRPFRLGLTFCYSVFQYVFLQNPVSYQKLEADNCRYHAIFNGDGKNQRAADSARRALAVASTAAGKSHPIRLGLTFNDSALQCEALQNPGLHQKREANCYRYLAELSGGGKAPATLGGRAVPADLYLRRWERPTHPRGRFGFVARAVPADLHLRRWERPYHASSWQICICAVRE